MAEHPNTHIRAAIDYALNYGWTLQKAGPRAHVWGWLFCPQGDRTGCVRAIYPTPKHPEDQAKDLRRAVDKCPRG